MANQPFPIKFDRIKRFIARHSIDDIISARFLQNHDDKLSWVDVEGIPLLVETKSLPSHAETLFFQIQSLDPNISLKEIPSATRPLHLDKSFLFNMHSSAKEYYQIQKKLINENKYTTEEEYKNFLTHEPALAAAYTAIEKLFLKANLFLAQKNICQFFFSPWIFPQAEQHEMLIKTSGHGLKELQLFCKHPQLGMLLVYLLHTPKQSSFKIYSEFPDKCKKDIFSFLPEHIDFLGQDRIPQQFSLGLFPQIFSPSFHTLQGFPL